MSSVPLPVPLEQAPPTGTRALERVKTSVKRYGSPKVVAGLGVLLLFALMGSIGPLVLSRNPITPTGVSLQPPSWGHWLGTTLQGQDVFTQLVDGTGSSLEIGFIAGGLATAVSVVIGLVAGYLRGLGGEIFSALSNVFLVIPSLPLIIVLAGYLPKSGFLSITVVIAVTSWAGGARLIRSQTLAMVQRDYVQSAKAIGEPRRRILFGEVLPNLLTIVMSTLLFAVIGAIAAEAGLAFLGLGNVDQVSWGYMINLAEANDSLLAGAWWWWLPPALCYALVGAALALMNFGIDEVGNPRLRMARLAARRPALGPVPARSAQRTEAAEDVLLEVQKLNVGYLTPSGTVTAVEDVDLVLRRAQVLGIAGESGSGKSTLANALTRLVVPPGVVLSGSVRYHPKTGPGVDLLSLPPEDLRRLRWEQMAVVFQSAMNALNPVLTIDAQMRDAISAHRPGTARNQARARVAEMLRLVGVPERRASSFPHELSGGMRQRVSIAMALLLEPELVVFDEPTTGLDVVVQRAILGRLLSLREKLGFSVIFITHDLSLLLEMCDTVAVMYAGRVVEVAPTESLYTGPLHPYSRRLRDAFPPIEGARQRLTGIPGSPPDPAQPVAGCPFHPRCDRSFDPCPQVLPDLLVVDGHRVRCHLYDGSLAPPPEAGPAPVTFLQPPAASAAPAGPSPKMDLRTEVPEGAAVLECRDLTLRYRLQGDRHRVVHAVESVSLALVPGQVSAIVGESGSGKSSLLRALALLVERTSGDILMAGRSVPHHKQQRAAYRSAVQLVFQDPFASMNGVRTIGHHLQRPLRIHGGISNRRELEVATSRLLERVSLTPPARFASRYPHELSGGQRQRVMIARALAVGPSVLLADEPVSMIDVSIQVDVLNLLADLVREEGLALLYVTHNIASARYIADTISVMYAGSIVESGPSEQLTGHPNHPYTRLLLASTPRPSARLSGGGAPSPGSQPGDSGEPPDLAAPPTGCRFHPRCPYVMEICRHSEPPFEDVGAATRSACWLNATSTHGPQPDMGQQLRA